MEHPEHDLDQLLWLERAISVLNDDLTLHQQQQPIPEAPQEQLAQIFGENPTSQPVAVQDQHNLGSSTVPDDWLAPLYPDPPEANSGGLDLMAVDSGSGSNLPYDWLDHPHLDLPEASPGDLDLMAVDSGSGLDPTCAHSTIGIIPDLLQQDLTLDSLLSNADQAQHPTLVPGFDTIHSDLQAELASLEPQASFQMSEPANILSAPVNLWPSTAIMPNLTLAQALDQRTPHNPPQSVTIISTPTPAPFMPHNASLTTIPGLIPIPPSSTSNTLIAPNKQRTLQPRPASPLPPQSLAPTSSAGPGALGMDHLRAATERQVVIYGPPVAPSSARKVKRKRNTSTATAGNTQPKRPRVSSTKIYTPGCHNYKLPANPGNANVPQKKNMHPCIRCKLDRKRCTGGHPCDSCQENMRKAVGRRTDQVLWRRLCVQTEIWEFNFFARSMGKSSVDGEPLRIFAFRLVMQALDCGFTLIRHSDTKLSFWLCSINLVQALGEYIVAHSPTTSNFGGWRLGRSSEWRKVPKRFRSGSKWKVPTPPIHILGRSKPEYASSGLVWVAICLHGDSFWKYLGLPFDTLIYPFGCLDIFFLTIVHKYLTIYRELYYRQTKPHVGCGAIAILCSFIEIAKRNYGVLGQWFDTKTGPKDWRLNLCEHAIGFAQFHLDRIKRDLATILPEKDFQWLCDKYKAVYTEIAEMDLSEWAENSLGRSETLDEDPSDNGDTDENNQEDEGDGADDEYWDYDDSEEVLDDDSEEELNDNSEEELNDNSEEELGAEDDEHPASC